MYCEGLTRLGVAWAPGRAQAAPLSRLSSSAVHPYDYREDPAVPAFPDDRPLLVFDGMCVLCSSGAQLVLRSDTKGRFRFAPAQSALGRALYRHYGMDESGDESVLLIQDGRPFVRSDVAIKVGQGLGGLWRAAVVLRLLPKGWRGFRLTIKR